MAFTQTREKLVLIQNLDSGILTSSRESIAKKKARPYRFKDSAGKWQLRTPRYRLLSDAEIKKLGTQGILGEVIKLKRLVMNERATAFYDVSKSILAQYLQSPEQFLENAPGLLALDTISSDEKKQIEFWQSTIHNGVTVVVPSKKRLIGLGEELRQIAHKWKQNYLKQQKLNERNKIKQQKSIELEVEAEYQLEREQILKRKKTVSNA